MRFSAEWQDPGVSASAELKATFCLLAIDVEGKRVSRFFDERYSRVHTASRGDLQIQPAAIGDKARHSSGFNLPDSQPRSSLGHLPNIPIRYTNYHHKLDRDDQGRIAVEEAGS